MTGTYVSVHHRLRVHRGRALGYRCSGCGLRARHWAFDHEDPDSITDESGRVFSLDLAHYLPLCGQCHFRFDAPYSTDPRRRFGMAGPAFPCAPNVVRSKKLGSWPPPQRPAWPPGAGALPLRW